MVGVDHLEADIRQAKNRRQSGGGKRGAEASFEQLRQLRIEDGQHDPARVAVVEQIGDRQPQHATSLVEHASCDRLARQGLGDEAGKRLRRRSGVRRRHAAPPGGEVRLAVGGEYIREAYKGAAVANTNENVAISPLLPASRKVKSGFAELNVPLVSPDNNVPLIDSLTLAGSIRYDHYSDFGSNVAPNVGVTWKPIHWISLRGRWNKSFQAPSLVQLSQASTPTVTAFPGFLVNVVPLLKNPAVPANGGPIVAVQGTVSPLQPQKAKDYNLGFDISPPVIEGLDLHFTYFNIVYSGQISAPPLGSGPFYSVSSFAPLYIMTPTIAQMESFLAATGARPTDIANAIASVNAQGGNAYVVADVRARNLGISKVNGFDFGFDYHRNVSWGTIDASYSVDAAPPLYRGVAAATAGGYWNGSTVGRLFQLGANVTF